LNNEKRVYIALPQMFTGLIFYFIHIILRNIILSYNFTLIRQYIADYLTLIFCIPLFVNIQVIFNIRKRFYITFYEIVLYFLIISIFCEIIGPMYSKHMTSDPIDLILYLIGGIVLYFSQDIEKIKKCRN